MTAAWSVDRQIISNYIGVCEHWAEYFEQLYQVDLSAVSLDAKDVAIPVQDPPITEDREAISQL